MGQAQIQKAEKWDQTQLNTKQEASYFLMSMGLDLFVVSPIQQWDPGGKIYLLSEDDMKIYVTI